VFGFIYLRDYFMTYFTAFSLVSSAFEAWAPLYVAPTDDDQHHRTRLELFENYNLNLPCSTTMQPSLFNTELTSAGMVVFYAYMSTVVTLLVVDVLLVISTVCGEHRRGLHTAIIAFEQLKVARPLRCGGGSGNPIPQFVFKTSALCRVWGIVTFTVVALIVLITPSLNPSGFTTSGLQHFALNSVFVAYTIGGLRGNMDLFGPDTPEEKKVRES
jgi:hypothetical protein